MRPEKIGALRSQTTTFIMIYKSCKALYICVSVCFCILITHQVKVKDVNDGWNKKPVCFSMREFADLFLPTFVSVFCSFWLSGSCWTHLGQWVLCFRRRRRSNINTEPLCYQQSTPERQRASVPLQTRPEAEKAVSQISRLRFQNVSLSETQQNYIFRMTIHF